MPLPLHVKPCPRPTASNPAAHIQGDEPPKEGGGEAPVRKICPHCGSSRVHKHGFMSRRDGSRSQRYRCLACGRTCSESTGTPVYRLKKRTEWDRMVSLLADQISLRGMAHLLGVQLETAFGWRHRALAMLCLESREPLSGLVNVSHILVPYSEKGSRICNGPGSWGYWDWLRRGDRPVYWSPDGQVRRSWPCSLQPRFRRLINGRPTCVMVAQADTGYEAAILGQVRVATEVLAGGLESLVRAGTEVYAFGGEVYAAACQAVGLSHMDGRRAVWEHRSADPASAPPQAKYPDEPRWWLKQFRGVATRYLPHYLAWYRDIVRPSRKAPHRDSRTRLMAPVA